MNVFQFVLLCALGLELGAAEVLCFRQSAFQPGPDGEAADWVSWSPCAEIAPLTFVDATHDRGEGGALGISGGGNSAEYGGWRRTMAGIEPGLWYRFAAQYQTEGVPSENWQVIARIEWRNADGKRIGKPDYASRITRDGRWKKLQLDSPSPEEAAQVTLELFLLSAPLGTVWWDDISFEQIPAPGPRVVTVASVNSRPRDTGSAAETVRQFIELIDHPIAESTDLIVLPECVPVHGTGKGYVDVAETIPGPTVRRFADVARRKRSYIAFGMYEREGKAVYNTAVLLDRLGNVAGKYRKVYVPHEELEVGITPGNDFPVFDTDFGKVGMMICYDAYFAEPARVLALNGAELLLLPIWGGDDTLVAAHAVENRIFLVSSGVGYPTFIMDPGGKKIAQAGDQGAVAVARIDLNRRYVHHALGDRRNRTPRELRFELTPRPSVF